MHIYRYFIALCSTIPFLLATANGPARVLVVTGELSGDRLAAWYVPLFKKEHTVETLLAVAGDETKSTGAAIIKPYHELSKGIVGLWDTISHFIGAQSTVSELLTVVKDEKITHLICIDCPFINMPLAWHAKRANPNLHITYLAIPELWMWGRWGIDTLLKKTCDDIVVLYPFEQEWYQSIGLTTRYIESPHYQRFKNFKIPNRSHDTPCIALLPGSRLSEVRTMLPRLLGVAQSMYQKHPELRFMLMLPSHLLTVQEVQTLLTNTKMPQEALILIGGQDVTQLAPCCCAVSKPGTITLELSFMSIPTIITFAVPWFTYQLFKWSIQVPYVGLPNLFLHEELFPELLQENGTQENIEKELTKLYHGFLTNNQRYAKVVDGCKLVRTLAKGKQIEEDVMEEKKVGLTKGSKAPDFSLPDQTGKLHTLKQYRGKKVALYFYPRDYTPNCTAQACSIRDFYSDLQERDIVVLGISSDSSHRHENFAEQYHLRFPLLSDVDNKVARSYDALQTFLLFFTLTDRKTVLINEEGIVQNIITRIDVANHAQQIIDGFEMP